MELSTSWLSDLAMEDHSFIHQCEMSTLDELTSQHLAAALDDDFQNSFSSESHTSYPIFPTPPKSTGTTAAFAGLSPDEPAPRLAAGGERPAKLPKTGRSWSSHGVLPAAVAPDASTPRILSFGRPDAAEDPLHVLRSFVGASVSAIPEEVGVLISATAARGGRRVANSGARPPSQAHDHIIAERRRREKISEMFIALSAIVPGLKKVDKASVLEDAVKYVKQLEERVKALEEQSAKRTVESVVLVKKSQLPADDDTSSSGENFDGAAAVAASSGDQFPEVEAKVSDKSVLLRIHCEQRKGVLVRVLEEVEKLHLSVVNTSVMPFAGSALHITVMAKVVEEFSLTAMELVKHLNSACREFM